MSLRLRTAAIHCLLAGFAFQASPVSAHKGVATGCVAMIDCPTKVYAFSSTVGSWSSVDLEAPLLARLVGTYIGYLRTERRIYAYNSTTNSWYMTQFAGTPDRGGCRGDNGCLLDHASLLRHLDGLESLAVAAVHRCRGRGVRGQLRV